MHSSRSLHLLRRVPHLTILNPFTRVFSSGSSFPKVSVLSSKIAERKFRDDADAFPLTERQESVLFERLPAEWEERDVLDALDKHLDTHGIGLREEDILLLRSPLGVSQGRALVASRSLGSGKGGNLSSLVEAFLPKGVTARPMDFHDTQLFVEQWERFLRFSDDLEWLANPDFFLRTVTISGIPKSYGCKDVAEVVEEACGVKIQPSHVVFRFKKYGQQSDSCFVVCPDEKSANMVIDKVQELCVPRRRAYGSLFGAAFLFADRSSHFIHEPSGRLDFALHGSKYWVTTLGWHQDVDEKQLRSILMEIKMFPDKIVKIPIAADKTSGFMLRFERMKITKLVFSRLNRLRRRWQIPAQKPFFAYPTLVDVHWKHEAPSRYDDAASDNDSDLDEPVMW